MDIISGYCYWILFLNFLVSQLIYLYIYITHKRDQDLKLKSIRIQEETT